MVKRGIDFPFRRRPMAINTANYGILLSLLFSIPMFSAIAQSRRPKLTQQVSAQTTAPALASADDISGMYSFEREGEFVQISVEQRTAKSDKTKPLAVTGFISRYGDTDSD